MELDMVALKSQKPTRLRRGDHSRASLARATGVPYYKLARLERGKKIEVTNKQAKALAKMLAVPVENLIHFVAEGDGRPQSLEAEQSPAMPEVSAEQSPTPPEVSSTRSMNLVEQGSRFTDTEMAFRAGCHAILRVILQRRLDDTKRQTVRELVETEWHAYRLGEQLQVQTRV